jgi:hypothetical protein
VQQSQQPLVWPMHRGNPNFRVNPRRIQPSQF